MKKKILLGFLIALLGVLLLGTLSVSAETEGYLEYEIVDGEVTITDCDSSISGDIEIPSTIEGYPVTTIGEFAFAGDDGDGYYSGGENLTSVVIPEGVTTIGVGAFFHCRNLKSITLPDGLKSIGTCAFEGCEDLENIEIPDSVTSIGDYAFRSCYYLESINIPEGIKTISMNTFDGCMALESIIIPDSVESIGDYAFAWCESFTEITIPDSVTSIEEWTFAYCCSLTEITIPDSVTSIGEYAFEECYSLTDVYYTGTEEEWNEIEIDENGNEYLLDATIHFITEETTMTKVSGGGTEFVVSPFNIEEGKTVILALYDNGMFVGMQSALYEGGKITFETDLYYTDAKVMVWGDMESFVPECEAEVINISRKDYTDCIIDVIDEVTERKIYFKNGADAIVYTDEDTEVIVKYDGEIIEAIDLYEDDVVAIFEKEDSVTIEVLAYSITGEIEGIKVSEDSATGYAYLIEEEYYNVAACVPEDVCDRLVNGYEGLFYTDGSNNILYFVDFIEDDNVEFVYVLGAYYVEDEEGELYNCGVLLLTTDGVEEYEYDSYVCINDVEYDIYDDRDEVAELMEDITGTVVKIEFNDGMLGVIYSEHEDNGFELVNEYVREWSAEDMAFGPMEVDEDSIVFVVGPDYHDEVFVTTIDAFVNEAEYEIVLYASQNTMADADIIVVYDIYSNIPFEDEYAIITDIEETENEYEEEIFVLTIMFEGEAESYYTTARVFNRIEDYLAIGDVVKVAFNNEDVIVNLEFAPFNVARYDVDAEEFYDLYFDFIYPDYDINGEETSFDEDGMPVDAEYLIAGYTYYMSGDKVHVEFGRETPKTINFNNSRRIYLVETSGRNKDAIKVTEGEVGDIAWDKELTIEINDEESIYDGKDVADINLLKDAGIYIENEFGEEIDVETIFTQIYATFTAEGDIDMIFLVAGEQDYEIVE